MMLSHRLWAVPLLAVANPCAAQPFFPPPPPPSSGSAILECEIASLDGARTTATIKQSFAGRGQPPRASLISSDEATIASMPTSASVAERGTLLRYTAFQASPGVWQLLQFSIMSSTSDRAMVKIFEQAEREPIYAEIHNTLKAVGICSVQFEDQ